MAMIQLGSLFSEMRKIGLTNWRMRRLESGSREVVRSIEQLRKACRRGVFGISAKEKARAK